MNQVLDGGFDENRLIEDHLGDQLRGHIQQAVGRDYPLDAVDDLDSIGVAALFHHRQIDRGLAVHADFADLDLGGVLRFADVRNQHGGLPPGLQRQ